MDFMELLERRTIRFFRQEPVPEADLRKMLDAARRASCGANAQILRYMVIRDPELVEKVFYCTAYAGKVKPRRSPVWGVNAPLTFIALLAPEGLQVRYLLAVGYPAELYPVQDEIGPDGNPDYYLDAEDRLHVPKYTVDALTEWK